MTDREAMKLALDALESKYLVGCGAWRVQQDQAITALKEALAQPEQEPVAWISPSGALYRTRYHAVANAEQSLTPLYRHPPQRTEQEPDVIMHWESHTWTTYNPPPNGSGDVGLYYAPPQRTWVGLTDDEIDDIFWQHENRIEHQVPIYPYERAIEARLKDKNR